MTAEDPKSRPTKHCICSCVKTCYIIYSMCLSWIWIPHYLLYVGVRFPLYFISFFSCQSSSQSKSFPMYMYILEECNALWLADLATTAAY